MADTNLQLNSNIRCIEMCCRNIRRIDRIWLNSNIRCIEMFPVSSYSTKAERVKQ